MELLVVDKGASAFGWCSSGMIAGILSSGYGSRQEVVRLLSPPIIHFHDWRLGGVRYPSIRGSDWRFEALSRMVLVGKQETGLQPANHCPKPPNTASTKTPVNPSNIFCTRLPRGLRGP